MRIPPARNFQVKLSREAPLRTGGFLNISPKLTEESLCLSARDVRDASVKFLSDFFQKNWGFRYQKIHICHFLVPSKQAEARFGSLLHSPLYG